MSVSSNLGRGWHRYIVLTITSKEYTVQIVFAFVPPHNLGNYPPNMGNSQDQALRTEKFRQNQALFRKYTDVDGALKNQIITAVEQVFFSPLVDHLTVFRQVSSLNMLHHLLLSYSTIYEMDLEENAVKMMGLYDLAEGLV